MVDVEKKIKSRKLCIVNVQKVFNEISYIYDAEADFDIDEILSYKDVVVDKLRKIGVLNEEITELLINEDDDTVEEQTNDFVTQQVAHNSQLKKLERFIAQQQKNRKGVSGKFYFGQFI